MTAKQRLDVLLYERGLVSSRAKARGMIMAGEVRVDGRRVDKPGTAVALDASVEIAQKPPFVSRGGQKLAAALSDFSLEVTDRVCADVGASTGGFTDCLLQNGAAHVYAIDVGYGQLEYTLRQDERVTVMERTNARYLQQLPQPVSMVVVDASFISLRLLIPAIVNWLTPAADVVVLIKPQFEAGRQDVGKGGVVRDEAVHRRVVREILEFAQARGFRVQGLTTSPITGPAGNHEFLAWFGWGGVGTNQDIEAIIDHEF